MDFGAEGQRVEFKLEAGPGAVKAVIAFANSEGGTLYVGVDDSGRPAGVADPDAEMTRLSSMLRDSVRPDVLMMTSMEAIDAGGRTVVGVHVGRGVHRPYYVAGKGPRPEGVYVRSGAASVPASETAILRMLRESALEPYEAMPSLEQGLTFGCLSDRFAARGLPLGAGEMRTLGMVDRDGAYTNLALLLSDQCPVPIKAAQFADDGRTVFTRREEFSGSLLAQLDGAYAFLESCNRYRTEYSGLRREDRSDWPEVALREALVNSVAHRDYSLSGPTLVSVTPSAAEVVSLGGLPLGIEPEDLEAHVSVPRNRALANVLFRLELIEAYGTGLERMRSSYAGSGAAVGISITANTFSVRLPNRNAGAGARRSPSAEAALAAVRSGETTRRGVQEAAGLSQATATRALAELAAEGAVVREGAGRATRYRPARP